MILRTLTIGGPWAVAAAEDANGGCTLDSELERMLKDPATADISLGFRSQFKQIVPEGPSVFTSHVFEYVDEPVFAFKRKNFRAVGFIAGRQLVLCHIVQLAGRKIPCELIESSRASYMKFQDHEQRTRCDFFRLN